MIRTEHLGRASAYPDRYDAGLLRPIPRDEARAEIGVVGALPFHGVDQWTAWELSWLDERGIDAEEQARVLQLLELDRLLCPRTGSESTEQVAPTKSGRST